MEKRCFDLDQAVKTKEGVAHARQIMVANLLIFTQKDRLAILDQFCHVCGGLRFNLIPCKHDSVV